jgi:hypothetical protein
MSKLKKNLSLDPEAVTRGERYCELHATNLSQLVNKFLSSLPMDDDDWKTHLSPVISRLLGIASDKNAVERYRQHLVGKYGH